MTTNPEITTKTHEDTIDPDQVVQLLDRDGKPVAGIGRLDQVIGADEAERFFAEREARKAYLFARAVQRWAPQGLGYRTDRRSGRTA